MAHRGIPRSFIRHLLPDPNAASTEFGPAPDDMPGGSRNSAVKVHLSYYCRIVVGRCSPVCRSDFLRSAGRWSHEPPWSRTVDEDQCGLSAQGRRQKSWSQEELAIASELNLRTIQRIEREASASLESKKALASALDLDIHDLDYQEIHMRQEWEYKVVETKDRTALQPELASAGAEGWELVSATAMFNTLMTKVVYTLILKRPRVVVGQ